MSNVKILLAGAVGYGIGTALSLSQQTAASTGSAASVQMGLKDSLGGTVAGASDAVVGGGFVSELTHVTAWNVGCAALAGLLAWRFL